MQQKVAEELEAIAVACAYEAAQATGAARAQLHLATERARADARAAHSAARPPDFVDLDPDYEWRGFPDLR